MAFDVAADAYARFMGVYAALDPDRLDALREACRTRLPTPPFEVRATAWTIRCRVATCS